MSMSWGGVIASALAGGAAGAASSVAKDIDDQQKAAIQAQRDAQLAKLARENQIAVARNSKELDLEYVPKMADAKEAEDAKNAPARSKREADAAAAKEEAIHKVKGDKLNAGEAVYNADGTLRAFNAKELDPAETKLKEAQARKADADAAYAKAHADVVKAKGAEQPAKPRNEMKFDWQPDKKDPNIAYDKTTGVTRIITPEVKEKAGVTHWYKPDEPGSPGKKREEKYFYGGKEIPFEDVERMRQEASSVGEGKGIAGGSKADTTMPAPGEQRDSNGVVTPPANLPPIADGTILSRGGVTYKAKGGKLYPQK
jgi:hypothetical protein